VTAAQRDESGYTLSEVLVALVIVSTAIVAIIGSLGSSVFVSRVHRDIVTSDAAVRRYAEQLVATDFTPCAQLAGLVKYPDMSGAPAGYTVAITRIEYADASQAAPAFGPTCAANPNNEVQQLTLEAHRNAGGSGKQTLQIVKRGS
jgi:prepilin-type N-terminal cleavage/methylation domain-containing protein